MTAAALHPDRAPPRARPPFAVGVVAPPGFDPPGLGMFVRSRLRQVLSEKRRTHAVFFHGVAGQPVSLAVGDLAREWGTQIGGLGGGGKRGRYVEHLRAMTHVASFSDAVVLVHGGDGLTADLKRLLGVCEWLHTPVRVFAFAGDPVPL